MNSYSQLGQDIEVLSFYKNKTNGYFLEIGASDGILLSNTYLLEKDYNWKGICCEPLPNKFIELKKNRPNSICIDKAVYNSTGDIVEFLIANKFDLLSGINAHIDKYRDYIGENKSYINVETILFNDLLESNNAPLFIDYLSLDTEGTELEILKSIDLTKYIFGLIDVEHNFIEPRRSEIKELLISHGYIYKGENKWDDSYIHNSLAKE
jgi:FkbM family methyltransferase